MDDHPANSRSSIQDLLSKVSRYEALFELTGVINAANDIESVGQVLARIDTSKYEAQETQLKAALEAAKAKVLQAEATLNQGGYRNLY